VKRIIILMLAVAVTLPVAKLALADTGSGAQADTAGTTRVMRHATKPYDPECPRCHWCSRTKFGGCGGPVPGYLGANFEVINAKVAEMGIKDISENLFVMGGKGYARLGNFIIGGGGYGATSESSGKPDNSARYAKVELGYGGAIVGATIGFSRYDFTAGALVGGGSITVTRRRARDIAGWEDAWSLFRRGDGESVPKDELNISSRLTANFWALEPFVDVKVRVLPFMALEFEASFLRAQVARGAWKMDETGIPDSPATNLGGPSLKVGVMFGS
jgi:hypothetical protein